MPYEITVQRKTILPQVIIVLKLERLAFILFRLNYCTSLNGIHCLHFSPYVTDFNSRVLEVSFWGKLIPLSNWPLFHGRGSVLVVEGQGALSIFYIIAVSILFCHCFSTQPPRCPLVVFKLFFYSFLRCESLNYVCCGLHNKLQLRALCSMFVSELGLQVGVLGDRERNWWWKGNQFVGRIATGGLAYELGFLVKFEKNGKIWRLG